MEEHLSNGYIFISHSHRDIEKVRQIRNDMENAGFDPLCFFLKCLSDEDEIEGLIKREIDSRELFVYIDSPNSRTSEWVRKEREYIDSVGNKKTVTINLECYDSMQDISKLLIRGLRVFISYAHRDAVLAFNIANKLREKEFQVLMDEGKYKSGEMIAGMIEEAGKAGAVIALLSENSLHIQNVWDEITYARSLNSLIIPIVVGDIELPPTLEARLQGCEKIAIEKPDIENPPYPFAIQDLLIDDENFNDTMERIADEIWNALKGKLEE